MQFQYPSPAPLGVTSALPQDGHSIGENPSRVVRVRQNSLVSSSNPNGSGRASFSEMGTDTC
jgi:hypothetical protein